MTTCSCWPCLIQLRETLSRRPHKERSSIASIWVRRGAELIWTEAAKRLILKIYNTQKKMCVSQDRDGWGLQAYPSGSGCPCPVLVAPSRDQTEWTCDCPRQLHAERGSSSSPPHTPSWLWRTWGAPSPAEHTKSCTISVYLCISDPGFQD